MSDLIEQLPEMLRKVAKTESDEGEYGITEHIDWIAADEIEHLRRKLEYNVEALRKADTMIQEVETDE